jgi:hypothetical protein
MYFLLDRNRVNWDMFDDCGSYYRTNPIEIGSSVDYIEIDKATEEVKFYGNSVNAIEYWLDHGTCYSLLINI